MPVIDSTFYRWTFGALALLLALAWLAYYPGLSGGFLFDDFINLDALGRHGAIDDWSAFWRYVTSGTADPTGRPLSLLSFLLDARNWPADPWPFLRSNVLLHLLNGALLFALLRALGRHLDGAGASTDAAALLGAGLWLLHPLLVSTTLYIVQREAMLPATFVLLGLLAYTHGRQLHAVRALEGAAWMLVGIVLCTGLAVLAKANGILLPLLALVLESTVLRAGDGAGAAAAARRLRWWRLLLIGPALLLAAYLSRYLPLLHEPIDVRSWTIAERLMTQPRVLLEYLQLLLVPRVLSTGLYNDAYVASSGWLTPWSTLPAAVAVVTLAVSAFALRRRWPVFAAGILFWFAGHLLESGIVPLELYFEHRNYLPALLLFWPLARALCRWRRAPAQLRAVLAVALLALLAAITWQRATLWGQPQRMAQLWATQNMTSPRAQATAAMAEMSAGRPDLAARRLAPLADASPTELQLVLNLVDARCAIGGADAATTARVSYALREARHGQHLAWRWLDGMLDRAASGACPGVDLGMLEHWINALAANPAMDRPGRRQDAAALAGRLALLADRPDQALAHFDRGLAADLRPEAAAQQAALLARRGHYAHALAHLDSYERLAARSPPPTGTGMARLHAWVLTRQGYWRNEFATLRRQLRVDLAKRTSVGNRVSAGTDAYNDGDAVPSIRHTADP